MTLLASPIGLRRRTAAGGFDPLSDISWHSAFWADDPAWTNPGDGNAVTTARDGSGNGRDWTQATAAKKPTFRATDASFNNRAVIEFDGTDDTMLQSAYTGIATGTVMVVGRLRTVAEVGIFNGLTASTRWALGVILPDSDWNLHQGIPSPGVSGGTPNTSAHLFQGTFSATDQLFVDGTSIGTASAGTESLTGMALASFVGGASGFSQLDLAFVGISSSVLSAPQVAAFEAWAGSYYGLTIS